MCRAGRRDRLVPEPLAKRRARRELGSHHLDRDPALERELPSAIHDAHAAGTDGLTEYVLSRDQISERVHASAAEHAACPGFTRDRCAPRPRVAASTIAPHRSTASPADTATTTSRARPVAIVASSDFERF